MRKNRLSCLALPVLLPLLIFMFEGCIEFYWGKEENYRQMGCQAWRIKMHTED